VVKCISSDYHLKWLAVGSSNDIISTLDPRTGEVFASWKTSEFSVSGDTIYALVITNFLQTGVWKAYSYTHETDSILQVSYVDSSSMDSVLHYFLAQRDKERVVDK